MYGIAVFLQGGVRPGRTRLRRELRRCCLDGTPLTGDPGAGAVRFGRGLDRRAAPPPRLQTERAQDEQSHCKTVRYVTPDALAWGPA
jgi:hypothetical protein